jgi:FkbM family methyltransferase
MDGIEPLAFSDNQTETWGSTIDGLPVLSPAEAAKGFGGDSAFVVTIYNPFHSFPGTRKQLLDLGCSKVIPVIPLRWKYQETFLPDCRDEAPDQFLRHAAEVREVFGLMWDDDSRREFVGQVACRLQGDYDLVRVSPLDQQYFPPGVFRLGPDEFFVDVGAYDGDTMRQFLALRGENFRRILALEPDPENFRRLASFCATLPPSLQNKIEMRALAAASRAGRLSFAAGGGSASAVSAHGTIEVECVRLDDLLAESRPTYIKMDIEGAEPGAIQGCRRVIGENRPVLAICVYHAADHLWTIPLSVHRLVPEYRFSLRAHMFEGAETVCYAVPPERMA